MQQESELGQSVLKGVSRSFYLTIRLLPRLMREPVSLGYLLARASDTIADTAEVPAQLRHECLNLFLTAMRDPEARKKLLDKMNQEFLEYQTNEKERLLLERLGEVFSWYDSVWEWSWNEIAAVMEHIVAGQMSDIQRFGIDGEDRLATADELETYCFQVAGSVGEFWTRVGFQTDHRFSGIEKEDLIKLGISYGKGLQLVNILRDIPEDYANGRSYLPVEGALSHDQLLEEAAIWRAKARKSIKDGLKYAKSLRGKRARMATVLPALIALKTLDLLDEADWDQLYDGVKVTRKEVRKCIWQALLF
ncbi:farnesyl-diphosphate farnesyltransferase [Rubritalea squalenifaciens DSM 18772]|uniref:Farnesyl-diphosphate farnesyltransferase n=1 Tax=Rubritalea squalenifaciens DSM 18772 TaxID=1123071 RepID=A0A1M6R5T0_9BACT|nr:squalene/phytoene synthase family protein [Rubritalea squalenifaciens]SHK27760.1 farnesyl-diphosphate farnesyltransferase [Rubritalea squalenifaciens DSM 18772]